MKDLVRSLTPVMLEIDAKVTTEPRVDKTICRCAGIPGTAMTNHFTGIPMWLIFKRGKMHGTEVPGIYFEITCDGFNYGCGFYHASAAYMNTMRRLIPKAIRRSKRQLFIAFHMEERYKHPHYPGIRARRRKRSNGWSKEELALWRKARF